MEQVGNSKRLDGIDLLRGLAIFFVLMNHVNIRLLLAKVPYTNGLAPLLVQSLVWNGQFGVQIFFAISGFLITSISLRRWQSLSEIRLRDFYMLRFARIAPLLFLLLLILSCLDVANVHNFVVPAKAGGLGRALLAALTFHLNLLEAWRGYLPGSWDVLWSLSVEEMFYLFFPVLARVLGRGKLFIVPLCTFVVLGPFGRRTLSYGNPIWQEKSYLGGMDAIALGCLTALLVSRIRYRRPALRTLNWIGAGLLILILVFGSEPFLGSLDRAGLEETILAIGTCLIIIAAAQTQWKSPHHRRRANAMEESTRTAAAPQARSIQLRSLSDAHVCSLYSFQLFSGSRQTDASGTGFLRPNGFVFRTAWRYDRPSLLGANQPFLAR